MIPGRRDHQASRGRAGPTYVGAPGIPGAIGGTRAARGLQEQTGLKGLRGRGERRALPVWMEQREQMDPQARPWGWWERPASPEGPSGQKGMPGASGLRGPPGEGRARNGKPGGSWRPGGEGVSAALTGSCCDPPPEQEADEAKASLPRAGRCAIDFAAGQATCRGSIKSCVTLWCMVTCN